MEGKEKLPYSQGNLIIYINWVRPVLTKMHLYMFCYFLSAFTGILVTIGRMGGAGIIYGWQIPSIIVGIIKSRSLFTSRYWHLMGQSIPS